MEQTASKERAMSSFTKRKGQTTSYNKCIASRNDGYALILSIDL